MKTMILGLKTVVWCIANYRKPPQVLLHCACHITMASVLCDEQYSVFLYFSAVAYCLVYYCCGDVIQF